MERKRMPLPEEILPASKGSNNEWQEVSSGHRKDQTNKPAKGGKPISVSRKMGNTRPTSAMVVRNTRTVEEEFKVLTGLNS